MKFTVIFTILFSPAFTFAAEKLAPSDAPANFSDKYNGSLKLSQTYSASEYNSSVINFKQLRIKPGTGSLMVKQDTKDEQQAAKIVKGSCSLTIPTKNSVEVTNTKLWKRSTVILSDSVIREIYVVANGADSVFMHLRCLHPNPKECNPDTASYTACSKKHKTELIEQLKQFSIENRLETQIYESTAQKNARYQKSLKEAEASKFIKIRHTVPAKPLPRATSI